MPANPNIIDALGVSWTLKVQETATLFYDHPNFGMLRYDGVESWICDNVNTLELTSQGSLPDGVLPKRVCVRPKHDGECGCYDLNHYNPPEDKCKCCDPECPIPGFLHFFCGSCEETCQGNLTIGGGNGLDGVNNPTGPTYGMCCTLCGVEVCGNLYCSGGQWYVDIYNNGVLCNTYPIEHTCCPLEFLPITIDSCVDCDSGGGGGTCDCSTLLADLATVTASSSGGGSATLSNAATNWSALSFLDSLAVTPVFTCVSETEYTLTITYEPTNPSYPGNATYNSTSGVCDPLEAIFDNVDLGDGVMKTITVTA